MRVARETFTKLIDDLDGGEAAETVTFGLDGYNYEIDLSDKNAAKLRKAFETYVAHGTKVSHRSGVARLGRGRATGRSKAATDREQNAAIRAWALKKKFDVAPRGRIKAEIVAMYHKEAGH
jgi:hypothetical protein